MGPQFLLLWLSAGLAYAKEVEDGFEVDPYLQWRPAFAHSLPVQILLTGIALTLTSVLFIHLLFTAQYHWPLAPVNYVLQISGVTTLLISLVATLHVVLDATLSESAQWPYMLSYISVNVPPFLDNPEITDNWSFAEQATWLVMNASTSALIQITHIQFLTLLYPSRLEGRLIFALLGPLAVVAAVMQLVPISKDAATNNIASAIRNVCNATLSLLFTAALFVWGLLVNRKQAWRTDGGTAAFGAAALVLALVSTGLTFLYVPREEEYSWLPSLIWAVILWQSFLGWWWWVGAGSGNNVEDEEDVLQKLERKARRETRRKEAQERRNQTKKRAKNVWRGVRGAFNKEGTPHDSSTLATVDPDVSTPLRKRRTRSLSTSSRTRDVTQDPPPSQASTGSSESSTTFHTLPRLLPAIIHRWYASLRHAHAVAARQQAVERVERMRELDRQGARNTPKHGWGLGSFGLRVNRPPPPPDVEREQGGSDIELESRHERVSKWQHETSREHLPIRPGPQPISISIPIEDGAPRIPTKETADVVVNASPPASPVEEGRSRSFLWWGPLANWRLQDSTTYR